MNVILQRLANDLGMERVNRVIAETNHAEALAEVGRLREEAEQLRQQIAGLTTTVESLTTILEKQSGPNTD